MHKLERRRLISGHTDIVKTQPGLRDSVSGIPYRNNQTARAKRGKLYC